jgi:hypothetical protein
MVRDDGVAERKRVERSREFVTNEQERNLEAVRPGRRRRRARIVEAQQLICGSGRSPDPLGDRRARRPP